MKRPSPKPIMLEITRLEDRHNPVSFDFRFDYDYSRTGDSLFFNSFEKVSALESAAQQIGSQLHDSLTAIRPDLSKNQSWTAQFTNPASGRVTSVNNLAVPQDTIVIYVSGRPGLTDEGGVAFAAPGSVSNVTGGGVFSDAVNTRGQLGAWGLDGTYSDFGPWGGSISFDTNTDWYFGTDPNGAGPGQVNFRSTVQHELGHILGYGTSNSWFQNVEQYSATNDWFFTGPASVKAFNNLSVPLDAGGGIGAHWAAGVNSPNDGNKPAIMNGDGADSVFRGYTILDIAGLRDIGWQVNLPGDTQDGKNGSSPPPPVSPPIPPPIVPPTIPPGGTGTNEENTQKETEFGPLDEDQLTIVSPDGGRLGQLLVFNPDGTLRTQFTPYGSYTGGVRAASAELTGDDYADIVTAPGPGIDPELRVYDGVTNALIRAFLAYEEDFTGGVFVATADLNGDGYSEIVTSADVGGGPRIRVFDGKSGIVLDDFWGIEDTAFRGGCRIALGDIDGDGIADLVVAAGAGGGPRIAIYNGASLATGQPQKLTADFFIFEPALRDGVFVSVGDVNHDGKADLVVGAGPGGAPRVFIADGKALYTSSGTDLKPLANFFAGDVNNRGGVRVSVKTLNADDDAQLIVAPGKTAGSAVTRYNSDELLTNPNPTAIRADTAFEPAFNGGVFVG
jgi:hypothetical protein